MGRTDDTVRSRGRVINNEVMLNHCIYGRKGEWPGLKKESNRGRNKEVQYKGRQMKSYCDMAVGKAETEVKIEIS